jgi:CheY-like chemotaxis protein
VADDMQLNQYLMGELLKNCGLVPVFAGNGQEALELTTKESFTLIFLDVYMPVMDGVQCARLIRGLSNDNANVPIIAVTANQFESEAAEFKKAGFTETLVKPVSQNQIDQLLFNLLSSDSTIGPGVLMNKKVDQNSELVIDLSYLKEVGKANSVFIINMLDSFCQTSNTLLSALEKAILKKEDLVIKDLLHQLKFPLGVIGQTALVNQITALETDFQQLGGVVFNEDHYCKISKFIPLVQNLIVQARRLITTIAL